MSGALVCCICRSDVEDPFEGIKCKHYFCRKCICTWLRRQQVCPICRGSMKPCDLRALNGRDDREGQPVRRTQSVPNWGQMGSSWTLPTYPITTSRFLLPQYLQSYAQYLTKDPPEIDFRSASCRGRSMRARNHHLEARRLLVSHLASRGPFSFFLLFAHVHFHVHGL